MSQFLIVAATQTEIIPLIKYFKLEPRKNESVYFNKDGNLAALVTGVGMVNTAFELGKLSNMKFDYALNFGIAGAFNRDLKIGEVVNIREDVLSEMGAENGENFINYKDLNLGGTNHFVNSKPIESSHLKIIKEVKGVTVNTVHGNETSIQHIRNEFNPDVESMEGAAFFRAFIDAETRLIQLRAISNFVELRDKTKWNIPLAISEINKFGIEVIETLLK